jgi:hypothetical protein
MIAGDPWEALEREIAAWAALGRTATLWWRDDDAGDAVPALHRLLDLSQRHGAPIALASVPARVTPALAKRVAETPTATVLQHGYAHTNHAPAGAKGAELGPERPAPIVVGELAQGWQILEAHFGPRFFPAMVPPWNRMAPYLPPYLAELRYRGLSQFLPRTRAEPVRGLVQVNTHADLLSWKPKPARCSGDAKIMADLVGHLAARRAGTADPAEATGVLTHHMAHDEAAWTFMEKLLAHTAGRRGVAWLDAATAFAPGRA